MKKITLLLLLLVSVCYVKASHIVGGSLHYEHLGGDQYLITLKCYRDCENSSTDFDNPASIGIFNDGQLVQNVEISLSDAVISDVLANANDPCLIPPTDICVKEAIYTQEITLPYVPGGYILAWQRCCRTNTLVNVNSNDNVGITLTTTIPDHELVGHNSNPEFVTLPPIAICMNEPFVYDHSSIDLDGDSLVYELCNPLLGGGFGSYYLNPPDPPPYANMPFLGEYSYEYPIASDPEFEIDPVTGLLTGTPDQLGVYAVGICVSEYRDGELINTTNRDFQFNVVLCGSQSLAYTYPFEECNDDLEVEFYTNAVGADSWMWDFGDPNTESDTSSIWNPVYEYDEPGTYTATVHVNIGLPCEDSATVEITQYLPPEISWGIEDFYCEDGTMIFDFEATSENDEDAAYYWFFTSFAEPMNGTTQDPVDVTFDSPGTYSVSLTVVESPCQSVLFQDVVVEPFPIAGVQEQEDLCQGMTFDFNNTTSGGNSYFWNFGDPNSTDDFSSEENPSYTYSEEGTYLVSLIVNQGTTCEDSFEFEVTANESPDPGYVIEDSFCEDGTMVIEFTGNPENPSNTAYNWEFSEGAEPSSATGFNPGEIVFSEPGLYNITITASEDPCENMMMHELELPAFPNAEIEPQSVFCEGQTFQMINLSTNATSYVWDFGDGSPTSTSANPIHTFDEFGSFTVSLTASTDICDDVDQVIFDIVPPDPLVMGFEIVSPEGCDSYAAVELTWTGEWADEVTWDMGDGNEVVGENLTYEYAELGPYTVTVTAVNEVCDVEDSSSQDIYVDFFLFDSELLIPNIFTPNEDDFNKDFGIFYEDEVDFPFSKTMWDFVSDYSMTIMDRWGNEVFSATEEDPFWNGANADDGTFYYIITFQRNCIDEEVRTFAGYVQVVR